MKMSEFKYNLPEEKIAKYPPLERGTTKLLVLDRETGSVKHDNYADVLEYIQKEDIVVLNETKVEKRRIFFQSKKGRVHEILFLNHLGNGDWDCLVKGARYVRAGDILSSDDGKISVEVMQRSGDGFIIHPLCKGGAQEIFDEFGHTPIPPYMKRKDTADDYIRYNTVFGRLDGSVASPTASLNLTEELLQRIEKRGITIVKLELKVGWGTFAPIREEDIEDHQIHEEEITLTSGSANAINLVKKQGGKVWAFGTTVARALESCSDEEGYLKAYSGTTNLYIYPGYKWRVVNHLVTNFHMPDSSLILLVSSFAGKELIQKAYKIALENDYKFLSYGDSMLII